MAPIEGHHGELSGFAEFAIPFNDGIQLGPQLLDVGVIQVTLMQGDGLIDVADCILALGKGVTAHFVLANSGQFRVVHEFTHSSKVLISQPSDSAQAT